MTNRKVFTNNKKAGVFCTKCGRELYPHYHCENCDDVNSSPSKEKPKEHLMEVYNKYKRWDELLCDRRWIDNNFIAEILGELWQAIKETQEKEAIHDSKRA